VLADRFAINASWSSSDPRQKGAAVMKDIIFNNLRIVLQKKNQILR
jgi:hypothetical protein